MFSSRTAKEFARVLIVMRLLMAIVLAFAVLSWDIGKNDGKGTRALHASLNDLAAHLP